jgi:hypothetical protein
VEIVNSTGNTRTAIKGQGMKPDISNILMFSWFEPVMYLYPVSKLQFPETTERFSKNHRKVFQKPQKGFTETTKRPGYFAGFADNVGYE